MKELSIKEKAKAYDEAIEKLRSLHDDYDTVSTLIDIKEELENIFPELKESEDERIRKEILDYIIKGSESLYDVQQYGKERFEKWIAWLEKQGEQKSEEVDNLHNYLYGKQSPVWSKEDKDYYDAIIAKLEVTQEDAALTDNQMNFLKSLKERYTWKPSDEQIEALESATENCAYSEYQGCLRELIEQLKKLREE